MTVTSSRRPIALRDTHPAMSEESTTPDLVELSRRALEAVNRRDFDAMMSFYALDAVYHGTEIGTFDGAAAHLFDPDTGQVLAKAQAL